MARYWDNGSGHGAPSSQALRLLKLVSTELTVETLMELAGAEMDVSALADALELDMATISRKLKALRSFDLVELKRVKLRHVYSLSKDVHVEITELEIRISVDSGKCGAVILRLPRNYR